MPGTSFHCAASAGAGFISVMFGQTAAEFMQKEVLPVVDRLYKHDWELTRQLLRKAADLDLLRLEIPVTYGGLGLDLISAAYVGSNASACRSTKAWRAL